MQKLHLLRPLSIKNKIRLGPLKDGGYVLYEPLLQSTDVLISYGVGWDILFEEDFNQLTGKEVWMFDPTMFGKYFFEFPRFLKNLLSLRLVSTVKYLLYVNFIWRKKKALKKKKIYFVNEGLASHQYDKFDTFSNHLKRFGLEGKRILLKIDIEHAEYDVFKDKNFYKSLKDVNQLLIEFHDLKNRFSELLSILEILEKDFTLVHIHGNNFEGIFVVREHAEDPKNIVIVPDVLELSFVRNNKFSEADVLEQEQLYPVKDLDFPNNPEKNDYPITFV